MGWEGVSGSTKGAEKLCGPDKTEGEMVPFPFIAFQWIISDEVPLLFHQREQEP